MKKICMALVMVLCCNFFCTSAEVYTKNETPDIIFDDCVDFTKVHEYSGDGLGAIQSEGEDRLVFEDDFTFFQRVTTEAEWITYAIPEKKFLSVQTYFWQGESLNHFSFLWSKDGKEWFRANPKIKTKSVGSDKWLPVSYEFKKLPAEAKYLKISFPAQNTVAWSPVMSSVNASAFPMTDGSFSDTIDTPYHEAVTVLKHLGFITGVTETEFRPNSPVTRAEFCTLLTRMLNLENLENAAKVSGFRDVSSDHWAYTSIETLYQLGFINGTSEFTFSPEEKITFSQAIKILISVLGYTPDAELEGGFPIGYLSIANRLHLIDRIINTENSITRGEAALYLYRATDTKCMERTVFGSKEMYNKKSQTLLEKYHNIEKLEAIVTEAGSASLTGTEVKDEQYFVADGVQYECGQMDMANFLGQRTIFYIQHADTNNTSVALYAFSDSDCYTDITYSQFLKLEENEIIYEKNNREKRISVNSDTRIIYNGRYFSRIGLVKDLPFQNGKMRLIDNDNDGVYEVISILDYQTYYLSANAKLGAVMSDYYFGAVNAELDNAQYVKVIRYDEWLEYDSAIEVNAGDIVQIAYSYDGVRAEVIILSDYTAGKIEKYSEKEKICRISGIDYKLSEYFSNSKQKVELGAEEVFAYLDSNGMIVALSYMNKQNYAYLQGISIDGAFETEGNMRLIRNSGIAETLKVTAKTKLNGKTIGENEFIKTFSGLQPQLVQVRTYSDGSIADITTASENTTGKPMEQNFSLDYQTDNSIYRSGNFTLFDSIYQLTNATKVFLIPEDLTKTEDYYVGGLSVLNADFKYNADLFDLNTQYQAAAVVIYQKNSDTRNIETYDPVMVVEDCSTYLNDENEYAVKLSGWVGGEKTELLFRSSGAENQTGDWLPYETTKNSTSGADSSFSVGDVIQFLKDSNGYCSKFRILFDASRCSDEYFYEQNARDYGRISKTDYYSELYSGYGRVEHIFSNKLFYCAHHSENWIRTIMTSNTKVYLLHSKRNTIYPAEITDLEIGNRIFVRMNFTNCNEIVIVQ